MKRSCWVLSLFGVILSQACAWEPCQGLELVLAGKTARGTVGFRVVDESGRPVVGAEVHAMFVKNDALGGQKRVVAKTDADGKAELSGKSTGEVIYSVHKDDEFYHSNGRCWFYNFSGSEQEEVTISKLYGREHWAGGPPTVRGRYWEPSHRSIEVMLKARKKTDGLVKFQEDKEFPTGTDTADFDLENHDWVAPYGQGVHRDITVKFIPGGGPSGAEDVREYALELTFGKGGGYIRSPLDVWSDYPYVQEAPLQGYEEKLVLKKVFHGRSLVADDTFHGGEQVVFRFRAECDGQGKMMSGHYGVFRVLQYFVDGMRCKEKGGGEAKTGKHHQRIRPFP